MMSVLWRALNTIRLDSVSIGDPLDRVESQSPGLSYVLIAKSVLYQVVWRADGIDSEESVCMRDQRTS